MSNKPVNCIKGICHRYIHIVFCPINKNNLG